MFFVIGFYIIIVYLLFFKFRWLPLNTFTKSTIVMVGVVLLLGVFTALRLLTPASLNAAINTRIVEIAPQVSGRVDKVLAERGVTVEAGTVLFTIDPTAYQAKVDDLDARLDLSRLRLGQYEELAEASAGSGFQLEQAQAETRQLEAQLVEARFDLDNTKVRAPTRGMAPRMFLKEGQQVSPARSVMAFMDSSELLIGGFFQQAALQNVKIGDKAKINFPALPGRVFESKVVIIPHAVGDTQVLASGQLNKVEGTQFTRLYPIYMTLPDDFPEELRKVGLVATVYIHTENAGPFAVVANMLQWIAASLSILS